MSAQPGSHIAGYRVVSLLGSGGMGDVYIVENESLKRREAMKVISVGGASNDDFQQRFANEARTAASLDHPSIITVHSYGVADGLPWFTMSYLDGPDLASAQLSPADAVTVIEQVASGLDYAHARTVVHRDIKPANIVVTRTDEGAIARAVMLDFGIAKLADSPALTAVNSVVGTAAYTAPEIISGQHASAKSDQYSLACTAYQLFAGAAPFRADSTTALMMAHVQQPPPALGQVRPDLAPLGPVLQRAMAKDPAARFPNCRAFADELKRALAQTQAGTSTTVAPTPGMMPPANPGTSNPNLSNPGTANPGTSNPGTSNPGVWTPSPQTSNPGMANPRTSNPGMVPPNYAAPHTASQPGMTPPPQTYPGQQQYSGQQSYPGMPGPGMPGPGMPGPGIPPYPPGTSGMPVPAWGPQQPAKKSKKGLWIAIAVAVVALIAIGGTVVALLPRGDDGPPPIAHPDLQLVTLSGTSCAVKDKSLYCWGSNDVGQIGDGSTTDRKTPVKVPGLTDVTAVNIGAYRSKADKYLATTCAVAEGDVYCWGSNYYGQVGDGSESERHAPSKVPGLPKMTAVVNDFGTTCAISEDKETYCWGGGDVGQLGTGNTATRVDKPTKITSLSGVSTIAAGGGTFCAVNESDDLYCWGANYSGQIGDGTTEQRNTPVKVQNLKDVASVSLGTAYDSTEEKTYANICAVAESKVYCWGAESSLSSSQRSTPVEVTGIKDAQQVSVGVATACAVADSKVLCWGNNSFGQVGNGDGSKEPVSLPAVVSAVKDVRWVSTGSSATCAGVTENDDVYCWGASWAGQIGNPGAADEKQLQPLKVAFANA